MKKLLLLLLFVPLLLASCIQDEALNAEADILACMLDNNALKRPPIIENDKVTLIVNKETDLTQLAPVFELTPGATISPESGSLQSFIFPQSYTVTSEDKKWQKTYTISVIRDKEVVTNYQFEGVNIVKQGSRHYQAIQELDSQGASILNWASGNSGYVLAAQLDNLEDDPTLFPTFSSDEGRNGKCVKMVTRKTNNSFVAKYAPIAAGNLFIGNFGDIESISQPGLSTHFGEGNVFEYYPLSLEGYYKYKAGTNLVIKNPQGDKDYNTYKDTWDIYAVLYDATVTPFLNGYNVLNDPSIIMLARLPYEQRTESDDWKLFHINFELIKDENELPLFNAKKLKEGDYNLAIVMSSSEEGAYFNGAENSTLCVDDVELKYTEDFE